MVNIINSKIYFSRIFSFIDIQHHCGIMIPINYLIQEDSAMGLFNFGKKNTKKDTYWDGDAAQPENALQHLINISLHGNFATEDIVQEYTLYLPKWQLHITPEIQQLTDQSAVLGFYIHHPNWGQPLYECCASVGKDAKTALGMAVGSFLFGLMSGMSRLFAKENARTLETDFVGKPHRFTPI